MNHRNQIRRCCWLFLLTAFGAQAGDKQVEDSFMQYDVSNLKAPITQDCAAKHGKYLNAIKRKDVGEFQLASISDDSRGGDRWGNRGSARSGYTKLRKQYRVPELDLVSQTGDPMDIADVVNGDKPVVLNFIFVSCTTICPVLSASFASVQELLGEERDDVVMLSITIDPEYDTPERLLDYSKRFNAGPQWTFLTGKLEDVVAVEKAFDIYRGSKVNHEPITLIRTDKDKPWLRLEGVANAKDIVAEYRSLKSGAKTLD
ncbi:MAG: SCO family protein [Candidatus Thiodiazotropha sp.]